MIISVHTAGACMRPWIWPGGTVEVRLATPDDLAVGDIAVWFDGHDLVSHRVVGRENGAVVTRADWSTVVDPPLEEGQLVGKAVAFCKGHLYLPLDNAVARLAGLALGWAVRQLRRVRTSS